MLLNNMVIRNLEKFKDSFTVLSSQVCQQTIILKTTKPGMNVYCFAFLNMIQCDSLTSLLQIKHNNLMRKNTQYNKSEI